MPGSARWCTEQPAKGPRGAPLLRRHSEPVAAPPGASRGHIPSHSASFLHLLPVVAAHLRGTVRSPCFPLHLLYNLTCVFPPALSQASTCWCATPTSRNCASTLCLLPRSCTTRERQVLAPTLPTRSKAARRQLLPRRRCSRECHCGVSCGAGCYSSPAAAAAARSCVQRGHLAAAAAIEFACFFRSPCCLRSCSRLMLSLIGPSV